jgi:alpha-tubulin suppressor-like RCC1 family protein
VDPLIADFTLPPGLTNMVSVAAGTLHNLALRTDGTVVSWGSATNTPPVGLTAVVAIAAGYDHSLALSSNGSVLAWGESFWGANNVPAGLSNATAISAAGAHSLALKLDGTTVYWGRPMAPAPVPATNLIAIAAGGTTHAFDVGLREDGQVIAWGINRLGGETNVPPGLSNVVAIAAGAAHSLALKEDGTVVAWGSNAAGQTNVPPDLRDVVAISAGGSRSLVVKSDGTVVAWGEMPEVPEGLDNIVAVSTGTCNLAIRARLKINSLTMQGGQPVLHFRTFSGRQYSAEYATEIRPSEWLPVPGIIEGNGRMAELRDTGATGDTARYYRLREWPQ